MKTEIEQAQDLLLKLRAARAALMETGLELNYSNAHPAPIEYTEVDTHSRIEAVWWMLQMAINDTRAMLHEWESDPMLNIPRKKRMP